MRSLGLEDGKRKAQGDVVSCRARGCVGGNEGSHWAMYGPCLYSYGSQEAGGPTVGSEAFVGVGGDTVFIPLTAVSPGFLEMFALTEGEKNLLLWQPNIFPSQAESSRGNNLRNTKDV